MILDYFHRLVQHSCFSPEVIALGLCTIEPKIAPVEDHTYVLDERDVARSRPCVSRLKSNTLATARVFITTPIEQAELYVGNPTSYRLCHAFLVITTAEAETSCVSALFLPLFTESQASFWGRVERR